MIEAVLRRCPPYVALVDVVALGLSTVVDVLGALADRSADYAEAYADRARWVATATRCSP